MKSLTPWVDAPNPGPHRIVGLNAQLTRDAEAIYNASKMEYLSQTNMMQAIINALNIAVPKEFKCSTNAAGTFMDASPYCNNNNPCTILLALRTLYRCPMPAKKQANNALFGAPWNPADPIKTYFDRLEECFVTAIIATPPYTTAQMMDMAIMTLQITGLYSQALTEWESLPPNDCTWDALKSHFATVYNLHLISGTTTAGQAGYHSTSNVIKNDDALNNIEEMLNHELSNLHSANNANHQSTQQLFSALTQQLAAITQQLAIMAPANTHQNNSKKNTTTVETTAHPNHQPWEMLFPSLPAFLLYQQPRLPQPLATMRHPTTTNISTTSTTVSLVATMLPSGTQVPPAAIPNSTIRPGACARMSHSMKPLDILPPKKASTKPSCRSTLPPTKLDMLGQLY
jgi:hypothetical protein